MRPLDLLLKRGANPNVIDGVGESPLYLAHSAGNSEAIRLLTEHGAILTCKSPLHLAVIRGELDEVRKLIEGGSSVDSVDGANVPLLHLAINVGHDDNHRNSSWRMGLIHSRDWEETTKTP